MMKPTLVLGSHTVGLGVTRALASKGVPVIAVYYDDDDHGYVSKHVQASVKSPHPEHRENEFIEFLVECAGHFGGGFLVPASDATLVAVSRHMNRLERHFVVACPRWDTARLFIDKQHTYALAEESGVPVPRTVVPRSIDDVEEYARAIEYPCLVKPCQSHLYFEKFHRKMAKVSTAGEMRVAYQEAIDAGLEVMLQEFIPGGTSLGANYNSYSSNGDALVEFTAQKVRNAPRDTGSPCVALSKHIPEVIEPGRAILRAMAFSGFACTEFKKDPRDGVFKLVEVNGRHNLSSLLAVHCGVNFPWIHYSHMVCGTLPPVPESRTGVYWIDLLRDVSSCPEYLFGERQSPATWLRPYFSPHLFAVLDHQDPKPFRKRCAGLAKTALRRISPS